MKNFFYSILLSIITFNLHAQTTLTEVYPNPNDSRVITTGVPFLLIASDARAASMGDMGVATSVDVFSQHWNPSKYAFSESKSGFGVSYTPYLSKLVNDISLGNVTYYNRLSERSAFAVSLKYFSLGEIEIIQDEFSEALIEQPNELTMDVSYSLRLADQFSMGISARYLRSDLKIQAVDETAQAASSFAVDISGYYQGEEQTYGDVDGRWRGGFIIQNLGPKIKYDESGSETFLPTNFKLGAGFDFILDQYNKVSVTAEVAKLLVPTPPIMEYARDYNDVNENGVYDEGVDDYVGQPYINGIYEGQDPDVDFLSGVFQSFSDAPGGFSEELKEFTWALGAEYVYDDSFALRAGFFNESEDKGARKFLALGAGFKFSGTKIDLSYLFSASKVPSPLENTLRFSLTFDFGSNEYTEY
ncbi:MAG: type IX secretion system outer membrane channel protein PorV [Flavobacteriales bacterium]|nr:type IX secretion system outer membrane channel protein PorV [Flavobacteriaceae bacterium]RZP05535.1 MAG: type IX secretion system outer membrane channel protein PorV [Flavobacteriales bacterium]